MEYFFGNVCDGEAAANVESTVIVDRTIWLCCLGVPGCTTEAVNECNFEFD